GQAVRLLRHAGAAGVAVVAGDAVGVSRAGGLAGARAADVRSAARGRRRGAGAGAVAVRARRGHAGRAARAPALRRRLRAARAVHAVARAPARRAVGRASRPRTVGRSGHRDALAERAGHVAGLALAAAGLVAADAVHAVAVGALVGPTAGD